MELLMFSSIHRSYTCEIKDDSLLKSVMDNNLHPDHEPCTAVLLHLALCHSIVVDPRTSNYNSSSPDELALVNGAKALGFEFINIDTQKVILIKTPKGFLKYKLLNVLEFTSARKRMSVIVRDLQS